MNSRPTINCKFKYGTPEALKRDGKLRNEFKGGSGEGGAVYPRGLQTRRDSSSETNFVANTLCNSSRRYDDGTLTFPRLERELSLMATLSKKPI